MKLQWWKRWKHVEKLFLTLLLHDVLCWEVGDIVLKIFVSCSLLKSVVLRLDQTIQKIVGLTVLLIIIEVIIGGSLGRVDGELSLDGQLWRIRFIIINSNRRLGTYWCRTWRISWNIDKNIFWFTKWFTTRFMISYPGKSLEVSLLEVDPGWRCCGCLPRIVSSLAHDSRDDDHSAASQSWTLPRCCWPGTSPWCGAPRRQPGSWWGPPGSHWPLHDTWSSG